MKFSTILHAIWQKKKPGDGPTNFLVKTDRKHKQYPLLLQKISQEEDLKSKTGWDYCTDYSFFPIVCNRLS